MTIPQGPDDGHTFEITMRIRGSSMVTGDAHHHDQEEWSYPSVQYVRAWSLSQALDRAREIPLLEWLKAIDDGVEDEHG